MMEMNRLDSHAYKSQDSIDRQLIPEDEEKDEGNSNVTAKRDWPRILTRCLIHLTPVAVTAYILQLNFRKIYWHDASFAKLNEYLGALQVAAKLHEILMVFSLSQVVLYYLQRGLCSHQGVPFGLFASAYHGFLGGIPLTGSYFHSWRAILRSRVKSIQWKSVGLALLVLLTTLMALVVGPSSAIVVIPRLDWWDDGSVFRFFDEQDVRKTGFPEIHTQDFDVYIPTKLFPEEVTEASLPGPCLSADSDGFSDCPFAGLDDLIPTLDFRVAATGIENVTIGASFSRRMFSRTGIQSAFSSDQYGHYGGFASASAVTSSYVLADYLSMTSPQTGATFLLYTDTPYIAELQTFPTTMGPRVSVTCDVDSPETVVRNFTFLGATSGGNSILDNIHVDLRTIWNESVLADPPETLVKWKDMSDSFGAPQMVGFVLRPKDRFGASNVSVCGIDASWTPMEEWAMSTGSPAVISNYSSDTMPILHALRIDEGWINAFNATSKNSTSTVLETFINNGLKVLSDAQNSYGIDFPSALSMILAKGIADGLARIGSEYTVNSYTSSYIGTKNVTVCRDSWCSQGQYAKSPTGPVILNGTRDPFATYFSPYDMPFIYKGQILKSFPEPTDIDQNWTRVSLNLKRYGYAYGFTTTAVKLAAAVLLLDALIVLAHCVVMIIDGRIYSYGQSLGELLAMAVNSTPTKAFKSGPEGISNSKAWGKSTSVQIAHAEDGMKRLQIVVDGEDGRVPIR